MLESAFQRKLMSELEDMFGHELIILKNDPTYMQGVPDLLLLYRDRWACLEVKRGRRASLQPNQAYWIETLNRMSFAAIIHPGNKEEVLDALQRSFRLD